MRIAILLIALAVAGCGAKFGPAGETSSSNYNPIAHSQGGYGSSS